MSGTILILVRHGATRANLCQPYRIQGLRPNSQLNEQGARQARAAGRALKEFPIAKIYSSPLIRARQTAGLIAGSRNLAIEIEKGIVEADVGLWKNLTWPEVQKRWPEEFLAFQKNPRQHGYLGGENLAQVRDRVLPALEKLVAAHPEETIAVVSHGVVNRVLLAHWLGLPLQFARRVPQDNAAFNIVEFRPSGARVRTVNVASHIKLKIKN